MNYADKSREDTHPSDVNPEAISISHLVHMLKRYRTTILISLLSVALAYFVVAILFYVASPAQRVTMQRFRLDFDAGEGRYPNSSKFSIADIVAGPILQRVYSENHLSDIIAFDDLTSSVFVLESNPTYEALAADYQARLADPKLTPLDRERIQNDFEMKRKSISKNEYSINFARPSSLRSVPEPVARKILLDVLNGWADFSVNQLHVVWYRIALLSPDVLKPNAIESKNPIIALAVLRSKANRVAKDIKNVMDLPGGSLVRTPDDHLSLDEIRLRLEEIVRFQIEPLTSVGTTSALIPDPDAAARFFESQVAADQRELQARLAFAESLRQAIALYEQPISPANSAGVRDLSTAPRGNTSGGAPETVMPQLSDTFLDRLLTLTDRATDVAYRQKLVNDYRDAIAETIPLQQAVAYDTEMLHQIRSNPRPSSNSSTASVQAQIEDARIEIGGLIGKTNQIYQILSRNMTPSTQLFTLTAPSTTQTYRTVSISRLGLYGVVVILLSVPVVILFCLLHNRLREEEATGEFLHGNTSSTL